MEFVTTESPDDLTWERPAILGATPSSGMKIVHQIYVQNGTIWVQIEFIFCEQSSELPYHRWKLAKCIVCG